MNTIAIYDRLTGKRLCFLPNAYQIGYTKHLNGLDTATFSLPGNDGNNRYCRPLNHVELWDGEKCAGLYRILPANFTKSADGKSCTYECESVLATLMDDVLFGYHAVGNLGTYTEQSIRYVLDRQSVRRWQLGSCAFRNQFLYQWENENLLAALFSVANPIPEDYVWGVDTTASPWVLSLKKPDKRQKGEIRYRKNMQGITRTTDPTKLCTRLYLLGYGEGDNQQTIKELNGGKPYLDSANVSRYGVISKIAIDRRFQSAQTLLDYGKKLLSQVETPYVSYEVNAAYIDGDVNPGDLVRVIDDEEGISELMRVVSLGVQDVTGERTVTYTLANRSEDIAATMADLSDRQRIADCYSQGAVNLDSANFAENADPTHPAELRFFVPSEAVRINAVNLVYTLEAFRSPVRGVTSKPAQAVTSSSGGGVSTTTSNGGGSSTTTSDGGGSSATTGSGGGAFGTTDLALSVSSATGMGTLGTSEEMTVRNHIHYFSTPEHDHGIDLPDHSHRVTIPDHSHSVTILDHSHDLSTPDHSHEFTIPAYTPQLEYGIFSGGTAKSARILVDGKEIPTVGPNVNTNVSKYLATDDSGRIRRGSWHTVRIVPDTLTRITANLQTTLFINPRGGADL